MANRTADPGSSPGEAPLILPPVLDLTAAEPLCSQLRAALDAGPVLLDAGAVERIATPCLQVLAAAAASARAQGLGFRLRDAGGVVAAAITALGLDAVLPVEA
jgi:anti-anti-sigma regulatory factor